MLYDKTCIIPQRLYHADNFHLLFHLDKMEEIDLYNICIKTKWIKKKRSKPKMHYEKPAKRVFNV
jgi:hypothetical protein